MADETGRGFTQVVQPGDDIIAEAQGMIAPIRVHRRRFVAPHDRYQHPEAGSDKGWNEWVEAGWQIGEPVKTNHQWPRATVQCG